MTSGTTGIPKTVLLKQKAVLNQIEAKSTLLNMDSNTRLVLSMSLSFAASIWQVYAVLFHGGSLILLDEEDRCNPFDAFKKSQEYDANIMCVTPSFLRAFLISNKGLGKLSLNNLDKIVLTGEMLHADLVERLYHEYDISIINAYGQAETADDTFHYIVPWKQSLKILNLNPNLFNQ
jgi:acyl-coenzyme A synthetase/AMP-(fatty) acid ligase